MIFYKIKIMESEMKREDEQFKPNLLSKLTNDELIKIIQHISEFYEEKLKHFGHLKEENKQLKENLKHFDNLKEEHNQLEEEHYYLNGEYSDLIKIIKNNNVPHDYLIL